MNINAAMIFGFVTGAIAGIAAHAFATDHAKAGDCRDVVLWSNAFQPSSCPRADQRIERVELAIVCKCQGASR